MRETHDVVLAEGAEQPSVSVEAGGVQVGGSAEGEGEQTVVLEGIVEKEPRPKLAQTTAVDPTLYSVQVELVQPQTW